jgi:hypothetical protein
MRPILPSAVLTLLSLLPGTSAVAKDKTDWSAVQLLKAGTQIEVVTAKETVTGIMESATETELNMKAQLGGVTGLVTPRTIARAEVRELYRAGKQMERRIPAGQLLLSSIVGAAVGVGIGAAYDSAHPHSEDPNSGKLVFGALGFFVGPAVTGIGRAIYAAAHRRKLVYSATMAAPEKKRGVSVSGGAASPEPLAVCPHPIC